MATKQMAKGRIEVQSYRPTTYEQPNEGPKLNQIEVSEIFSGDVQGAGTVRFLQAEQGDGSASYCGIERVVGTLEGRKGTFLLEDQGTLEGSRVKGTWFVIPGSGTGDLRGLRGDGGFEAELGQHASWTLSYWFE